MFYSSEITIFDTRSNYHSLISLICLMLIGEYPDLLKLVKVIPLHKGDSTHISTHHMNNSKLTNKQCNGFIYLVQCNAIQIKDLSPIHGVN